MNLVENVTENFLAQEMSILTMSGQRTTNLLQLQLCKTLLVCAFKKHELVARIQFCKWIFFSLYKDGEYDPHLVFYPHGALFSLCGKVNSQNTH